MFVTMVFNCLPVVSFRRVATLWVDFVAIYPAASTPTATRELAHALLAMPALEALALPRECVQWLWSLPDFESDAAWMLGEWAIARREEWSASSGHLSASETGGRGASTELLSIQQPPDTSGLCELCHCADASRLVVRLLSTHLPALRAQNGALLAVLELVRDALATTAASALSAADAFEGDEVMPTMAQLAPDAARAAAGEFASSAELQVALGRLCMCLPGGEALRQERTLVLQLLATLILVAPRGCQVHATSVLAATHHAAALLLPMLPSK